MSEKCNEWNNENFYFSDQIWKKGENWAIKQRINDVDNAYNGDALELETMALSTCSIMEQEKLPLHIF